MIACARCDAEGMAAPDGSLPEGWSMRASTRGGTGFPVCADCSDTGNATTSTGDAAADRLRLFIERIERLEEESKGIRDDIKDVYSEAKATGYDTKVMKEIVKRRRMDGHALREFAGLLETYEAALGMQ